MGAPLRTLVVDNGAYAIKSGFADNPAEFHTVRNCSVRGKGGRILVADQVQDSSDLSGLIPRVPFEKGYITDWELEKDIWKRLLSHSEKCKPGESTLLITEPYFNLPNIRHAYDEIVFEEFGFAAYHRSTAAALSANLSGPAGPSEAALIVDSGYSFTHVVPVYLGRPIWDAIKRIEVGGKLLTNHLKEIIAFRQWNMMEETFLVNEIKEQCCYVSERFDADLEACRLDGLANTIKLEYVLPDLISGRKGYIRSNAPATSKSADEQVLIMNNERFTVPEILFNPSDIGIEQAGLAEAIYQAVSQTDSDLQPLLYANVLLTGGNARLPGFAKRLQRELRSLVPSEFELRIHASERPETVAWEGGVRWVTERPEDFRSHCVTREEYMENGALPCARKFDSMR
ncbi:actin-like protein ARP6 [Fimicolochytrium jonesii]|uniref:actin-like protein ARP6 n=1 Tax=Fimicolochytrium jonesii TaxID=1396493 RepID=UPI0022FE6D45|nr:actin-like protein ARP6 [Fimicolochytrium jonesii]KAI8819652.1 actin-like protein ARP6 [Fimicolochytrium jonesii]